MFSILSAVELDELRRQQAHEAGEQDQAVLGVDAVVDAAHSRLLCRTAARSRPRDLDHLRSTPYLLAMSRARTPGLLLITTATRGPPDVLPLHGQEYGLEVRASARDEDPDADVQPFISFLVLKRGLMPSLE